MLPAPSSISMPPVTIGSGSPSETLPQLIGQLALSLWGLTALSVADETGLLDALSERSSVKSLAAKSGLLPCHAEAIADVLVAIGAAWRDEDTFGAVPMLAAALAGPTRQTLTGGAALEHPAERISCCRRQTPRRSQLVAAR